MRKPTAPDAAAWAGIRWMCQHDLYALAFLLNQDRPENALTDGFHKPLCEFIQTTPYRKNLYLLPRGFFKTSLITVVHNIQRILRNPSIRILIASNKSENAEAMLGELKGHLTNPWLLRAFPDILWPDPAHDAEKWTSAAVTVKRPRKIREATVETIGVSGEVVSKHYDHGTFDDVVGKENSQTRELREQATHFVRLTESLFDPGSTQAYVGTPWHYADTWAWLLEQKATQSMQLGTYIDPCWTSVPAQTPGAILVQGFGWVLPRFPERFPVEELLRIRAFKGSAEFAAQYLLDPVSSDTAVFRREMLKIVPRQDWPSTESLWWVLTVDPAISTHAWADYSAVAAVGFDSHGEMWIGDLRRGKWREGGLVQQIYDVAGKLAHNGGVIRAVGFEAMGFQQIYRTIFTIEGERRGLFLPVTKLERQTKITKQLRIRTLQPPWEQGEVHIASDCQALDAFVDEASKFRTDRDNEHDDLLDCVTDAYQLRGRPSTEGQTPSWLLEDPELMERQVFETMLLARKPDMDPSSLRIAWSMHRHYRERDLEREAAVLGVEREEFYG